ncbi:tetratricopeptide repeat protein [Thermodesulfobacteriota bacterium]
MNKKINSSFFNNKLIVLVLFFIAGFAIYSGSMSSSFHFDDMPNIIKNADITITELSYANLKKAAFTDIAGLRPVSYVTFAFNHYLSGTDTTSYHILNILIHIISAFLIYLIILVLFDYESADDERRSRLTASAFFTALIWLVYPINSQAVIYIVQRMTLLMIMFFLLAFLTYIIGRKQKSVKHLILCVIFFALSLLSKQNGFVFPIVVLMYELIFIKKGELKNFTKKEKWIAGGLLLVLSLTLFIFKSELHKVLYFGYHTRDFTMTERLLTQFRVLLFYISLILLPLPGRLSICHDIVKSTSLFSPISTLFSLIFLIGMALFATLRMKKSPYLSFAILWFFITISVESSILPLEMIYEHRINLPCIFLIGAFVDFIINRYYDKNKKLVHVLFLVVIISLSTMTVVRSKAWKNELTLWSNVNKKYPNFGRGYFNLAIAYTNSGMAKEAEPNYLTAIKLMSDKPMLLSTAYNNLGYFYKGSGNIPLAKEYLLKALDIRKDRPQPYQGLGEIYFQAGNYMKTLQMTNAVINLGTTDVLTYRLAGLSHHYLKDYDNALKYLEKTVALNPEVFVFYNDIGLVYMEKRDYKKALHYFKKASSLNPDDSLVQKNLMNAEKLAR